MRNGPLMRTLSIKGRVTGIAIFDPPKKSAAEWAKSVEGQKARRETLLKALRERNFIFHPWMGVEMTPYKRGYKYGWTLKFTWMPENN